MAGRPWEGASAAAALAAAAQALGEQLHQVGDPLRGSDRSLVLRARLGSGPDTVVVKVFDPARCGEGWVREAAALTALRGTGARVADVVGVLDDPPTVITRDLGSGPSLADALLGSDAGDAAQALVHWAEALAGVHVASVRAPDRFADELRGFAGDLPADEDTADSTAAEAAGLLGTHLPRLGVEPAPEALRELSGADGLLGDGATALSPADCCPDNNVRTSADAGAPDGLVLLDFEGATRRHVAWDAAYLQVPWPSCWCAWRVPADASAKALLRWRELVTPTLPAVGEAAFDDALAVASSAWALISTAWFLPAALDGDPPSADPALQGLVPGRRAMIQHRLQGVVQRQAPGLPALNALAEVVLAAAVKRWGPVPLALAPAFR